MPTSALMRASARSIGHCLALRDPKPPKNAAAFMQDTVKRGTSGNMNISSGRDGNSSGGGAGNGSSCPGEGSVTAALSHAGSMPALLAALEQQQRGVLGTQQLQPDEVAAALQAAMRLVKAHSPGTAAAEGASRSGAQMPHAQALDALSQQLLAAFAALGTSAFAPSYLAVVVYACAKLQRARAAGDWRSAAMAATGALLPSLGEATMAELTR